MKALFTSDLHLTDRDRDEYRWSLFPWLIKQGKARECDTLFLLGDVTDAKDCHSSKLVNRVVDEVVRLRDAFKNLIIITGNHDFVDSAVPFLRFLKHIPGVIFEIAATEIEVEGKKCLLLPNSPGERWRTEIVPFVRPGFDFVLFHQCLSGSLGSNGLSIDSGCPPSVFSKSKVGPDCHVIGGDIHVPQFVGNAQYCGSPYPVAFGDAFRPRVLYYNGESLVSIKRTTIRKIVAKVSSIEELDGYTFEPGDQVKIVLTVSRSELCDWQELQERASEKVRASGAELFGVAIQEASRSKAVDDASEPEMYRSTAEAFDAYADARNIAKPLRKIGRKLISHDEEPKSIES